MRHSAWLNAVPAAGNDESKAARRTRLERLADGAEDYEPDMPPVEAAAYLLGYLFEAGPAMAGAMGQIPITHTELAAWQANTGIELNPWEARMLRSLSREFVAASYLSIAREYPAPWQPGIDLAAVARSLQAEIEAMV